MPSEFFSASKSWSDRQEWIVTFPHPTQTDNRGNSGIEVSHSLATSDEAEADRRVAQLNELLQDEAWWNADRRADAESRYDSVVVSVFFDEIEVVCIDPESRRDEVIPLPSDADGYSTVLFLGTTGAGKTTLLRHVIGSDPKLDRFPSTSTARTTTADFEIVTAPGRKYVAAVTFMSEDEVRAYIDECLEKACLEAVQKKSEAKIASALLEHREQRFRLSYILGSWLESDLVGDDDDFSFDNEDERDAVMEIDEVEIVSPEECEKNLAFLKCFVKRIKDLTKEVEERFASDLGKIADQKTADDRETWLELFGSEAAKHPNFSNLTFNILKEVLERFSKIKEGDLRRSSTDWPLLWVIESQDRGHFLSAVRWFSSNHHKQFGRLLTPLVNGIRVRGPLFPELPGVDREPRFVLLDGQGLGHTATSASSVSTRITRRFPKVNMILLVDNAQQPMQAAPLALLRAVGSSGFARKLAIAFTHFDQVKGANLGSSSQRRHHVLGSVGNATASLRDTVGSGVAGAVERQVEEHFVLLGGLDRSTVKLPNGIKIELSRLVNMMQSAIEPPVTTDCSPMYDFMGLEIAVRDAIEAFRNPWSARLGLSTLDGISKEHWTRIKALNRRFAHRWADEYDTLTPVADLLARLQEEVSKWLDRPVRWTRQPESDSEREIALDAIREVVFKELSLLIKVWLTDKQVSDWSRAYDFSGRGSTRERSQVIDAIYDRAAPRVSTAMSSDARTFFGQLYNILRDAIIGVGGQVLAVSNKQSTED